MYPEGRYNINFDFCTVMLAVLLLFFYSVRHRQLRRREKLFCDLIALLGLTASFEVVFLMMRNDSGLFVREIADFAQFMALLSHNLIPYFVTLYVIHWLAMNYIWSKKVQICAIIPLLIAIVILIVPQTRHMIYVIGEDGSYQTSWLYGYLYAQTFFYILLSLGLLIRGRKSFVGKNFTMGASFTVVGFFSTFLACFFPYLKITNFIQMLIMLCLMMTLESGEDYVEPITRLGTRQAFADDIRVLMGTRYSSCIFGIKLKHFAYHRAVFGGRGTNLLLKMIADWLMEISDQNSRLYYIGQGTFAIIRYQCDEQCAQRWIRMIQERFQQNWKGPHVDVIVPMQICRADYPERVSTLNDLMLIMDTPYDEKIGSYQVINSDGNNTQKRLVAVEKAIRRALQENAFEVYYQPIYDTKNQKFSSAEALIRLNDPELGFISPEEFIKIAEQNGTINQIGFFVFEEVCKFIAEEKPEQYGVEFVEVNLSTIQALNENLPEILTETVKKYNISPHRISLEITESSIIFNTETMLRTVNRLREAGFHFALDDFGTGYSNYSYIITFPLTIIKLDKSILWAADADEQKNRVLEHMIQMAHELDMQVVAEGVETPEHRQKLENNQVEYLQGYYFSKPVPKADFLQFLCKN